jgi:hypothetical protein
MRRVAGDRVTCGHVVAGVEEVEDDPYEAVALRFGVGGGLSRGLGVTLGLEQVALQAGVGDQDDAGEGDHRRPDGRHQVDEDRGDAGERDVGRDQRPCAGGELAVDPDALQPPQVRRDEDNVQQPGHEEEGDDRQREPGGGLRDPQALTHGPRQQRSNDEEHGVDGCVPNQHALRRGAIREDHRLSDQQHRQGAQRHHSQHEDRVGGDHDRPGGRADDVAVSDQRQRPDEHDDERVVPVSGARGQDGENGCGERGDECAEGSQARCAHRAQESASGIRT